MDTRSPRELMNCEIYNKMLRRILIVFLLVLISGKAFPEHIIGGEMYYECLGGNLYRVTMKLFQDCSGGLPFDAPAKFSIFDESNTLVMQRAYFIESVSYIEPDTSSPCLTYPPDICVEEGIYSFNVELPSNTQAYKIVYQRCCRNVTIQNLTCPVDQGLTIVAEVPALANAECNSMPQFNNFPPPVLCAQQSLSFDHSATDSDGDSLAYSLCSPYLGATAVFPSPNPASSPPYTGVLWAPGFSAGAPLNANPGLSINPITGLLTGKPTQLGQFVVGVCVEEWRNEQLLSTNRRDFQFNVALCEQTYNASIGDIDRVDICDNLTISFENLSGSGNEFEWNFGDPANPDAGSTQYSPSYTYPDTGTYEVSLITNPGFFCSDTAYLILPLYKVEVTAFLPDAFEAKSCLTEILLPAISEGGIGQITHIWNVDGVPQDTSLSAYFIYHPSMGQHVQMKAVDECGNFGIDGTFIPFNYPEVNITTSPDTIICPKTSAELRVNVLGGSGGYKIDWGDSDSTVYKVKPKSSQNYTVVVTDTCGMKAESSINVNIRNVRADFDYEYVPYYGLAFTNYSRAIDPSYLWDFGDDETSTLRDPRHMYKDLIPYRITLTVTDNIGCTDMTGLNTVPPLEIFIPNSFTPNGDGINDLFVVKGANITGFTMRIYDRWGSLVFHSSDINEKWDGSYSNNSYHSGTTVYNYVVRYKGKKEEDTKEITGFITVIR